MKAIKTQNRNSTKQLTAILSMLLFLCIAGNTAFAGNTNLTGCSVNPDNLTSTEANSLSTSELEQSEMLLVENNTLFSFSIPQGEYVRFSIFDTKGRELKVLIDDNKPKGEFSAELKQANLTKDTYYYRLVVGKYKEVRKLNIIK